MICRYNMKRKAVDKYYILDSVSCRSGMAYNVICWKDFVIEIPAQDNIIRAIRKNGEIIELYADIFEDDMERFYCVEQLDSALIVFPLEKEYILKINEEKVEKIPCGIKRIISTSKYKKDILLVNNSNNIWRYSINSNEINVFLKFDNKEICWCTSKGENVFFSTKDGKVYYWSEGVVKEIIINKKLLEGDYFSSGIILDTIVFLFPYKNTNTIYQIDLESNHISFIIIEIDNKFNLNWKYNSFSDPVLIGRKIYFMSPKHRALFVFDTVKKSIERHHVFLKLDIKDIKKIGSQISTIEKMYNENDFFALDDYLTYMIDN